MIKIKKSKDQYETYKNIVNTMVDSEEVKRFLDAMGYKCMKAVAEELLELYKHWDLYKEDDEYIYIKE